MKNNNKIEKRVLYIGPVDGMNNSELLGLVMRSKPDQIIVIGGTSEFHEDVKLFCNTAELEFLPVGSPLPECAFTADQMIADDEYEKKVQRLAKAWTLHATVIEEEICVGFETIEPTRLMWSVHAEMVRINPIKAKQFSDYFFRQLD